MSKLAGTIGLAGLLFVGAQAMALPIQRPLIQYQQPSGSKNIVVQTIEASLKENLSDEQSEKIRQITENIGTSPQNVMFEERGFTALICIGAKAAFFLSGQVGICSDLSGNRFYTNISGLGAGAGLAGQVYMIAAVHDPDMPISPSFTGITLGGTSGQLYKKFELLKKWTDRLSFVGPELGIYHSVYKNQMAIMIGANIGKIITGQGTQIQILDTFAELKDSVLMGESIQNENFDRRLEARKLRLGIH